MFAYFQNYNHAHIGIGDQKVAILVYFKFLVILIGGIQQLRGPNFTQFLPPPLSSRQLWTFYMTPFVAGPLLYSCPCSYGIDNM